MLGIVKRKTLKLKISEKKMKKFKKFQRNFIKSDKNFKIETQVKWYLSYVSMLSFGSFQTFFLGKIEILEN